MKTPLSIGYQLPDTMGETIVDLVRDYRDDVGEVYFAWVGGASGRAPLGSTRGYQDWQAQPQLEADLIELRQLGVRLNLLFNSNCYGRYAISEHLQHEVASTIDHLGDVAGGIDTVTTTSLAVAHIVKSHYPEIEVRASVNMRLGTVEQLAMVADRFDSYCLQRDYNRDVAHLAEVKAWADREGKTISLLVNSGCLRLCPAQTFHDNLVAHESEIDETRPLCGFQPHLCHHLYHHRENWPRLLQATWIRPEDLHHLEGLAHSFKLATRMHARPRMVVHAYATGSYPGNLLDLFEPGFGPSWAPAIVDNQAFPADWWTTTSTCGRRCHQCNYCARTLDQVLVNAE